MPAGIYSDEAKRVLDKMTSGTTVYRNRYDEKHVRVVHIEEDFALVEWRPSIYYNRGANYCSGYVEFARIPEDLRCSGGRTIWGTGRERHGRFTDKTLAMWLKHFRASKADYPDNIREATRKTLEERGIKPCLDASCLHPARYCVYHGNPESSA